MSGINWRFPDLPSESGTGRVDFQARPYRHADRRAVGRRCRSGDRLKHQAAFSATDRDGNDIEHIADVKPVAGHGFLVQLDVQHWQSGRLFHLDVRSALNRTQYAGDLVGGISELLEVIAEYLDRDVTANAGDQLVETHLNGLCELIIVAGKLAHSLGDPVQKGRLGFGWIRPIGLRFEDDERIRHVWRHGICSHFRRARL